MNDGPAWQAHTTARSGVWVLNFAGHEVGMISFLDAIPMRQMHVDRMVDALNDVDEAR